MAVRMNGTSLGHVFADEPDRRQAPEKMPVSRFRPRYRSLDADEVDLHDRIKTAAEALEALYDEVRARAVADQKRVEASVVTLPDEFVSPSMRAADDRAISDAKTRAGERARLVSIALTDLEKSIAMAVKGLTG